MRGGLCVHVINPVKFLISYSITVYVHIIHFVMFILFFYPITVFIFITFQEVFKEALELSYHLIRHFHIWHKP